MMQSGYVSLEKVACGSCEDKVSLAEVQSCCSTSAVPSGDLCSIEQKCCKTEKSNYQLFRISQSLKKLELDDFSVVHGYVPETWNIDFALEQFSSRNIKGPPLIRQSGRDILISICKYTL